MPQPQTLFQNMKMSLAICSFLAVTSSYGADFLPDERLALGTPFKEIERIFPGRKEAYISTNESGSVESGLVMVSFNDFWDSVLLDIRDSKIAAASYVNAIHPFVSLDEVMTVLECLKAKFVIPADNFWLYTFDRLGPVCSPAYGWDVGEHYVVFAHSPFGYTSNGSHFQCQMTVMPSRRDISKHFVLSDNAIAEYERAGKYAASCDGAKPISETDDRFGRTPLMLAALDCDFNKVKSLLESGADVAETDKTGFTVVDVLTETINRLTAIQPENMAAFAAKLLQSGFLEKDARQLARLANGVARSLPKEPAQVEAMKQILYCLEANSK